MSEHRSKDMIDFDQITTRPAREEDRRFCYEVKRAALRRYVEPIWGWDEQVQEAFHLNDWQQQRPSIIALGGRDIGTVEFVKNADHYHLGEFYLFQEFQRQGIGTYLMERLMRDADEHALPIKLEVIQINPVRSLYLRCGFAQTGTTKTHYLMERMPNKRVEATPLKPAETREARSQSCARHGAPHAYRWCAETGAKNPLAHT